MNRIAVVTGGGPMNVGLACRSSCATHSTPGTSLHTEPGTPDGVDGVGGSGDFDSCGVLPTEQIEQQLARMSGDANRGFPSPGSYRVGRPGPLEFEPCAA